MASGYMRDKKKKGKITKAKAEYFEGKDTEKKEMKRSLAC